MRFDSLTLARYGNFTGRRLEFASPADGAPDLHIICGDNEAGKTVLRGALVDFLYGIPTRSAMNFVHEYGALEIGARVSAGNSSHELTRTKGSRNTLRDAEGKVVEDALLADLLGQLGRNQYMARFALGHDELREQSAKMLDSDLAGIFYASASGLRMFTERRKRLTEGAEKLGPLRTRKKTRLKVLRDELVETDKRIKAQSLTPLQRDQLVSKKDSEANRLQQAREQQAKLIGERVRLENLARAAEIISEIVSCERQIAEHDEHARAKAGGEASDATLADTRHEITVLHEQRIAVRNHRSDIEKRQRKIRTHEEKALKEAESLGWKFDSAKKLAEILPEERKLAAGEDLLGQIGEAVAKISLLLKGFDKARDELKSASDDDTGQLTAQEKEKIEHALQQARRLGDVREHIGDCQDEVDEAGVSLNGAIELLRPWRGDLAGLRELSLPGDKLCEQHRDDFLRFGKRRDELQVKLDALDIAKARLCTRLDIAAKKLGSVTAEELQIAREMRDSEFDRLWDSGTRGGSEPDKFRELINVADDIADSRYERAEQIAEHERLSEEVASNKAERDKTCEKLDAAKSALQNAEKKWLAMVESVALVKMIPEELVEWKKNRAIALKYEDEKQKQEARLAKIGQRAAQAALDLRAILPGGPVDDDEEISSNLEALVIQADKVLRQTAVEEDRAAQLRKLAERAKAAKRDLRQGESEKRELQGRLDKVLGECGLDKAGDPAELRPMLRSVRDIAAELNDAQGLHVDRIVPMCRDLDAFADMAKRMAERLAPGLADELPAAVAAKLWVRVEEAQQRIDRLRGLRERLAEHKSKLGDIAGEGGVEKLRERVGGRQAEELRLLAEQAGRDAEAAGENVASLGIEAGKAEQELAGSLVDDGMDVALQHSRREQIIAAIAETADEYLGMMIGARMLSEALEMYRRENASPMLENAGRIFSKLACDRYSGLALDQDETELVSKLAGGEQAKNVKQLSEGTRDQLFLALRLAGLGDDLNAGRQLPFIADDLFITFDDMRAGAGFEVLAEYAQKTQMIYLTHHDHLAKIAQNSVPEVNLLRLPAT